MTGMEATARSSRPRRHRLRLPGSRGGMAWLAVLVLVGVLLAVQIGRQVYTNWEIGREAARIEAEIAAVEAENERLSEELQYLQSAGYVSAEARRLANLGLPGEQVLIIPPGAEEPIPEELLAAEEPPPMLEQWVQLFFGSSPEPTGG